jgi:hypothetical protein
MADDIERFRLDGLHTDSLPLPESLIWLNRAHDVVLRAVDRPERPTSNVLRLTGGSADVFLRD